MTSVRIWKIKNMSEDLKKRLNYLNQFIDHDFKSPHVYMRIKILTKKYYIEFIIQIV